MALGYDNKKKKSIYSPRETPEEKAAREMHESFDRLDNAIDESIEIMDKGIKRMDKSIKKLDELTLD